MTDTLIKVTHFLFYFYPNFNNIVGKNGEELANSWAMIPKDQHIPLRLSMFAVVIKVSVQNHCINACNENYILTRIQAAVLP